MEFRQLTNQEFSNFVNNFPLKSIYQTKEYALVMNHQGFDSLLLGMVNDGVVIAATLILIKLEEGFKYAYAPRGFIIDYENFYLFKDFTNEVKKYLNKLGIMAIKINPLILRNVYDFKNQTLESNPKYKLIFESLQHNKYYHLGYNNYFEALKPRFEAIINLNTTEVNLFKNVKKNHRTKIRGALKNGVTVVRGTVNELEYLYNFTKDKYIRNLEYYQDCMNFFGKEGMIDYFYTKIDTNNYLQTIQKRLAEYETKSNILNFKIIQKSSQNPKNLIDKKIHTDQYLNKYKSDLVYATQLLREHPEGIITSAMLIVKFGKTVTILIDGDDKNFRNFNSKHLLIWTLMNEYRKQGYETFNLGGLSNMVKDESKYTGLNEFKLNFGAKMVEYAGDFELITNKRNYNLYRNYVPLKNLIKDKLSKN